MGAYLSKPITEKESEEGENEMFKYGVAAMQGWRTEMEDAHAMSLDMGADGRTGFFAVFDGHGGKEVAQFVALKMADELVQTEAWNAGNKQEALVQVYLKMDELLMREETRPQLEDLAGDASPDADRQPVLVDAADLPESLRLQLAALDQARARSDKAKRPGQDMDEEEESEVPAELAELDNTLAADVAAAVARAAAESEATSMESSPQGSDASGSPPDSPTGDADAQASPKEGRAAKRKRDPATEAAAGTVARPASPAAANGIAHDSLPAAKQCGASSNADASSSDDDGAQEAGDAEEGTDAGAAGPPAGAEKWTGPMAGCTAVAALVSDGCLTVANAGDSRCVLCRGGKAVAMTNDHKPNDDEEHSRILKAGGFVADGRVNGSLNLSRALGDMEYKQSADLHAAEQIVTAVPEVRRLSMQPGDEFLLLACDGIWDVLTNQEAVNFVRERLKKGMVPKAICEALCDACLAPNTNGCGRGCDNMSAMVVLLKGTAPDLAAAQA